MNKRLSNLIVIKKWPSLNLYKNKFLILIFLILQNFFAYSNQNNFMLDDLIPDQMCLMIIVEGGTSAYCSIERNELLHRYQYISDNLFCAVDQCLIWESIKNITFISPYESETQVKEHFIDEILHSAIENGFEYVPLSVGVTSHRYYNGSEDFNVNASGQIIENAPKNRYNKHKLKQTQHCIQKLNDLSLEISTIRDEISRTNSMCFSFETGDPSNACIYLKNNLIHQKITNLIQSIEFSSDGNSADDHCFSESQIHSFMTSLKTSLENLSIQYTTLVQSAVSQTNYKILNDAQCNTDIYSKLQSMFHWAEKTRSFRGNIYTFNQGLSAMNVLKDYITVQAEICTAGGIPEDEKDRKMFEDIQSAQLSAQDIFSEELFEFEDTNSKKWCDSLQKETGTHLKLCEEPLYNPSWVYSIHYQVQQMQNGASR